ncbi:metal-dependent hydrolase [Candidatus Gottesmanbacteria bacterium]|nr:metal-dependent hydrolase [Candidatus Gottesmanbacteria bacterium]
MTILSHILSGSLIALTSAKIAPTETGFVAIALISSAVLDLDHLYYLVRDRKFYQENGFRGKLHKARSPFHELLGVLLVGMLSFFLYFFNPKAAYLIFVAFLIHLTEDILVGKSLPFNPVSKAEINLLPQKMSLKIKLEAITLLLFIFLWTRYLQGII